MGNFGYCWGMNIPEDAVEAAFTELPDGAGVYVNRDDLRLILEAAAPHMLADREAAEEPVEAQIPWDELRPYEKQQGGYWAYPKNAGLYGEGREFIRVAKAERMIPVEAVDDVAGIEWGVEYRGVTVYESEAEARRHLNLAQMDAPAVLVNREVGAWELVP